RYSGKERDATGLYYYGFRYYAPWLGRWINPDPAGTIDGLNLYRMVRNNPIALFDTDGLASDDEGEPAPLSVAARRKLFSAPAANASTSGGSSKRSAPALVTKPPVATKPVVSTPSRTVPPPPTPATTNPPLQAPAVASNSQPSPIVLSTADEQTTLPSYAASSLAVGKHQLMLTSSGSVVAMRGDNRTPEQIRAAGGFFPRDNRGLAIKQEFKQEVKIKGINTKSQEHVRNPVPGYVSTGMNEESGGYGDSRAYLYRMEIPGLREQVINDQTMGLEPPFTFTPRKNMDARLLMSGATLEQSEFVAVIPGMTVEMTFITPIPSANIVAFRAARSKQWESFH
ncbi:RHS repeat-associated core domain-containing protein, partial [Pseudomonas sp. NPDC087346]|uniref:RHS repeat-associated core domain-containing protein n=1 Tax=Pseudomonas sp. NPDC087346 TaxID=3364438 RepID=UPI0038061A35